MESNFRIEEVKELTSNGKLEKAMRLIRDGFKEARKQFSDDEDWKELEIRFHLISGELHHTNDIAESGLQVYENTMAGRIRITKAFLSILDDIKVLEFELLKTLEQQKKGNKTYESKEYIFSPDNNQIEASSLQAFLDNPQITEIENRLRGLDSEAGHLIAKTFEELHQERYFKRMRMVASGWLQVHGENIGTTSLEEACENSFNLHFCNNSDSGLKLKKCVKRLVAYLTYYFSHGKDVDIHIAVQQLQSDNLLEQKFYHILADVFSIYLRILLEQFDKNKMGDALVALQIIQRKIEAYKTYFSKY